MKASSLLYVLIVIILGFTIMRYPMRYRDRRSYTERAFHHYAIYVCKHRGICSREQALAELRETWPNIFYKGYDILDTPE